ncbi:MAG: cell division protein FtsA [Candidatus Kapaibacteriales bacterium]
MGNNNRSINVALDIGTHKVACLVAENDENGLKILGLGVTESEGLNRGVVVQIGKTVETIKKVIAQAESQSGIKIEEVTVGIAGDHIEALQTRCLVGISGDNPEVRKIDVDRLLQEAKKLPIKSDDRIIHILPSEFIVDGQDGITDPLGMSGTRLEGIIHVITGKVTAIKNIERCVEKAGLKVKNIVLEPMASSRAVISRDEKEVGVALVDIGGGTTDIAVFQNGVLRFTSIFAIAGKHVTEDVKEVFKIIQHQAEKVKREHGHCYPEKMIEDKVFMVPGIAGRQPRELNKLDLSKVINARMEEIFSIANSELQKSGYGDKLGAGIVLTGGTCLLNGTEDLAHDVFENSIKLGIPAGVTYTGLGPEVESPVYATGVGLLLWAFDKDEDSETITKQKIEIKKSDEKELESSHSEPKFGFKSIFKSFGFKNEEETDEEEESITDKISETKKTGSSLKEKTSTAGSKLRKFVEGL